MSIPPLLQYVCPPPLPRHKWDRLYLTSLCIQLGEIVKVVEEHLGQIVSNKNQEQKNVDMRLGKGRNNLYSYLGAGFSYKCMMSPVLKLHIYRTFSCPITRSGLSSFALRSSHLEPLSLFQRKTLKSILKLSISAPTPSIHFLTGELPIEGKTKKMCFLCFLVSGQIQTLKSTKL